MKTERLYGRNPVLEALRAGRRKVQRLWVLGSAKEEGALAEILELARSQGVDLGLDDREGLRAKAQSPHHQGVVAEVFPVPLTPWRDYKQVLKKAPDSLPPILLALDQIQDPQNLGAILRSAEATGVSGILVPERHSAPLSPAVSKASAGALEYLDIISVKNLAQTLADAKKLGFWVAGTAGPAGDGGQGGGGPGDGGKGHGKGGRGGDGGQQGQNALEFDWPEPLILVMGGEGPGMRRLTTEHCDFLLGLPLLGRISSLNVAQATTALLYLRLRSKTLSN